MPANQAPGAMAFVIAAKLVPLGRIVAGRGPIAHSGKLGRGEQLQLPHEAIVPDPTTFPSVIDHAKSNSFPLYTPALPHHIDTDVNRYRHRRNKRAEGWASLFETFRSPRSTRGEMNEQMRLTRLQWPQRQPGAQRTR